MNIVRKMIILIIGALLALSGCSKAPIRGFVKPGLTVSPMRPVETIAVFPFDNISGHPDASKKVGNLLLTELVRTELFTIADTGEVENSLRRMRIRTTAEMDLEKLREIGERLKVEAVIVGSVDEYELRQDRTGTVPVIGINARMLDTRTGEILWTVSHTRDGNDWETVFGFGKVISLNQLAQIVVSETVESLVRGAPTAAYLTAVITASPAQVSEGQDVKIVMTITNSGQAAADDVVPSALLGAVNGVLSPPGPAQLTIPGGRSQDFTWIYTTARGDAGDMGFSGNAFGKDHSSEKALSFTPVDSNVVAVQVPADLTSTIAVSPAQVSEGQEITVVMTVINTGQANADDVTPVIMADSVNGILSSASPANAAIPGGGSQDFTWTYISAGGDTGELLFSGNASGKDHNSGKKVSSPTSSSNIIHIQTPTNLAATVIASPVQVSEGQNIKVVMKLTNTGQATADAVIPSSLTLTGIQTLRLSSSPPSVEVNIPGGASQDFTWIYASSGGDAGSVMFSGSASGRDHNSGNGVFFAPVDSNVVRIQTPANLTASITASPAQLSEGRDIEVVMSVTNSGQTAADDVIPSALALTGIQTLRLSSGPVATNVTIPGGGGQDFTWVYTITEGSTGSAMFSGNAYGKDHNSGNRVSFAPVDSNVVEIQTPASLTATITLSPDQVSEGQDIKVLMTVTNSGQATANDVIPSALAFTGAQTLTLTSGPVPVSAAINAGKRQDFRWVYTSARGDSGNIGVSGSASGKDHSSGESISSAQVNSNFAKVQTSPNLTATIAASPAQVSEGQDITIVMTVANTGQATADAVIPAMIASSVSGILSSANPVSATIPGGGRQDFTWIYTSDKEDEGIVVFIGNVSGKDHNSRNTVSFGDTDSNVVSIQTAVNLTATITASPAQVSEGQDVTVVMTIANTGQATADSVMPSALTLSGIQTLRLSSSPTLVGVDIPGGGSHDFTWIYTSAEGDAGSVIFSGSASGRDHNSGRAVSSSSTDSNTVSIQIPADLAATITASPAEASAGQYIAVTMTVVNRGQATADAVIPSLLAGLANGILSSPIPVSAAIPGGGRQDFAWTYVSAEEDLGNLVFSGKGSARDHNSGKSVLFSSVDSNVVSVQPAANLEVTITASPVQISAGQEITVVMKVGNMGQSTAYAVTPSKLTLLGVQALKLLSGPEPTIANISGSDSQNFTWTYVSSAEGTGDVAFSGSASGKDINSGKIVSSASVNSGAVNIRR